MVRFIEQFLLWIIPKCRRRLYRMGVRPKYGSIWYSPSLTWIYTIQDMAEKEKNWPMGNISYVNYDENNEPIFFRSRDGSSYVLNKRTKRWSRSGYQDSFTTEHLLEFSKMLNFNSERKANEEASRLDGAHVHGSPQA